MNELGKKIKIRREELGLTQEELATELGYKSRSTIAKIESGENDISQSKLKAFADALETTPSDLLECIPDTNSHLQQIRENRNTVIIQRLLGFMGCKIEFKLSEIRHNVIGYKVEHKEISFDITVDEFDRLINSIKSYMKFTIYELIEKHSESINKDK